VRILAALLALLAACGHARPSPAAAAPPPGAPGAGPPPPDPLQVAPAISDEMHALVRTEGELLWARWTTGAGPTPAAAAAEHPRIAQRDSAAMVESAALKSSGADAAALRLLGHRLAAMAVARQAGDAIDALERARAQLSFTVDDAAKGERDLDRLLTEEPAAQKRAAIALAEAKAAQPLVPLALARDAAVEGAISALRLGSWASLEERAHGMAVADLAALAEKTLVATEAVAAKAAADASTRNLGITIDRLRRADLPRLVREAPADAQFPPGHAWPAAVDVLSRIGVALPPSLQVDAEPSPSKGARPLALLIDPPSVVRLSLRPAGGIEEQRAVLHEGARAVGGALTSQPRWELAQLGDGSAAEGAAQLFESLCGEPEWLRATTRLRGEPLDELVHTEAARRLLAARRTAAMVLFEIQRRAVPRTAEAQAALYRGLVQRATYAILSDEDAGRWSLESDAWIRSAAQLQGALLAAQLEVPSWWSAAESGERLKKIWSGGRSLTASDALRALGLAALDPAALATVAEARLAYKAPDPAPPAPRPDYKYMQGDKKRRRKHR
jgi:hypothetical protein